MLIPILIFMLYQHNEKTKLVNLNQNCGLSKQVKIEILPDELKINENKFHAIGYVPKINQKVVLFGFSKNKQEQQLLKSIKTKSLIEVTGDLSELEKAPNFNQFDSNLFYGNQGIHGQIKVRQINKVSYDYKRTVSDIMHLIRYMGLQRTSKFPKTLKMYVQSLLFGFKNSDFKDNMLGVQQLGLIHLFSISGMHVYFLINFVMFMLSLLHIKRESIDWLLIFVLPGYFIVAGASVGLLRVILMVEGRLGVKKFGLYFTRLDIWSFALMINLLINPMLLLQFGCQLSYILSFALIYANHLNNVKRTIMMNVVGLPFILFNLYEWHILSLLANILIIPFFSLVIFPIVIIGYFLAIFNLPFVHLVNNGLLIFDKIMIVVSKFPGEITFGKPIMLVVIGMVILSLLILGNPNLKNKILLISLFVLTFLMIHFPLTGEITFFDVGQGDSTLIRQPFNTSITLIDTGGKPNFFAKEGQKTVYLAPETSIRYLKSIGINHIDNICLSHQDADHIGYLPAYLKDMQVDNVYIPWGMSHNQHFMKKIKPFMHKFKLIEVKDGNNIFNTPLQVVHPFIKGLGKNEDSMVLFGRINEKNWLFTGDLTRDEELKVLKKFPHMKVDIIKLGHHGSKTASDPNFIAAIKPKIGIISAGRNNRYGHPNDETLETMKNNKIKTISTQKNGMITYKYSSNDNGEFNTKWKDQKNVNS
ncbi:competence protein ComEC [Fructilactobacillus lindneri DSM 20690 = JCM 11027]|nr:competence protein ComEC [Fructilactobacillus lindneri DSM 20690 = JCM 11027]